MSTVAITYVGPADEVEVDGLGVVRKGETVECPAELANGTKATGDDPLAEDYHPGVAGLLANDDLWKKAAKSAKGGDSA